MKGRPGRDARCVHFFVLLLELGNHKFKQLSQPLNGRPAVIDHRVGALMNAIIAAVVVITSNHLVVLVLLVLTILFVHRGSGRCLLDQDRLNSLLLRAAIVVAVHDAANQRRSMGIHARYLDPSHH